MSIDTNKIVNETIEQLNDINARICEISYIVGAKHERGEIKIPEEYSVDLYTMYKFYTMVFDEWKKDENSSPYISEFTEKYLMENYKVHDWVEKFDSKYLYQFLSSIAYVTGVLVAQDEIEIPEKYKGNLLTFFRLVYTKWCEFKNDPKDKEGLVPFTEKYLKENFKK